MKKIIILLVAAIALAAGCTLAKGAPKTETVSYSVNMHCENCVQKLTDNLSLLKGVTDFQISLENKTIMITFDPSKVKEDKFVKIINKLGYTVDKIENGASSVTECDDCETDQVPWTAASLRVVPRSLARSMERYGINSMKAVV